MPKVAFSKLIKIKTIPSKTIVIADAEVTVAQYLPLAAKLDLIQSVIEQSGNGEEGFYNIVKLDCYYVIEMIKAYTNISFTEKQLEDTPKLYDTIMMNHIWKEVEAVIPDSELDYTWQNLLTMAREITDYNHSALGILKVVSRDYGENQFTLDSLNEMLTKMQDPNELKLVKSALDDMA